MSKWHSVLLVLSSLHVITCIPHLVILQNDYSTVKHVVEATAGSHLSLTCTLEDSEDLNLVWGRRSNELWFKHEIDLIKLANAGSKQISDLQNKAGPNYYFNKAIKRFEPLKLEDQGLYFCMSPKYMLFKIVRVKIQKQKETEPKHVTCNEYQFRCGSGECLFLYKKCNGIHDCLDNSDEEGCGGDQDEDEICCGDGRCFPARSCCDTSTNYNCYSDVRPACCPSHSVYSSPENRHIDTNPLSEPGGAGDGENNSNKSKRSYSDLYIVVASGVIISVVILLIYFLTQKYLNVDRQRETPPVNNNSNGQMPMPTITHTDDNEDSDILAFLFTPLERARSRSNNSQIDYLDLPPTYASSVRNSPQNSLHSSAVSLNAPIINDDLLPSYDEALAMTPIGSRRSSSAGDTPCATPEIPTVIISGNDPPRDDL